MSVFLAIALAATSPLPTVPGALNPNVTQANIQQTICRSGWTATIRPPASYTDPMKRAAMAAIGATNPRLFEWDHAVPLELGGNPTSPLNLWLQSALGPYGFHQKDALETRLKTMVCHGTITLAAAQNQIRTNWVTAYRRWFPGR